MKKKQPGENLPPKIKGMFRKMIDDIWGNLRSKEARMAWAKAQAARTKIDDALFRQWLIEKGVPDDLARRAWEQGGTKFQALRYIRDQKEWIEYYNLTVEVNAAFQKHTPQ